MDASDCGIMIYMTQNMRVSAHSEEIKNLDYKMETFLI